MGSKTFTFKCPACDGKLRLNEECRGSTGTCYICQSTIQIPNVSPIVKFKPVSPPDVPPEPPQASPALPTTGDIALDMARSQRDMATAQQIIAEAAKSQMRFRRIIAGIVLFFVGCFVLYFVVIFVVVLFAVNDPAFAPESYNGAVESLPVYEIEVQPLVSRTGGNNSKIELSVVNLSPYYLGSVSFDIMLSDAKGDYLANDWCITSNLEPDAETIVEMHVDSKDLEKAHEWEFHITNIQCESPNVTPRQFRIAGWTKTADPPRASTTYQPRITPYVRPAKTLPPPEITVFTADNVFHIDRDCLMLKGKTVGARKLDKAKERGMTRCPDCTPKKL